MDELSEEAKPKQSLGFRTCMAGSRGNISALARAQERAVRNDRSGFCGRGSGFFDQTWIAILFDPAGELKR